MKSLVTTLCYGEEGERLAALSLDLIRHYAGKVGADFRICRPEGRGMDFPSLMLARMGHMRRCLGEFDRVLCLDLDVMVRPDAPDLFALVPPGAVAAHDECTAVGADYHLWLCHQHVVQTCREEGVPIPESRGRYFNCGVLLAPASAAGLFEPRRVRPPHPWCEQSLVNVRLFLRPQTPVYLLPECCNRLMYFPGLLPRRAEGMSWFVHFAGPPDGETRLRDMRELRDRWRVEYAHHFPWEG